MSDKSDTPAATPEGLIQGTLVRPSPEPAAKDPEQTTLRATLVEPQPDPDATKRTLQPEIAETAARTLKTPYPASGGASAYAATLQAPAGSSEGTQALQNRRAYSLGDEGQHAPLQPGSVIKQRFVLETLLGKGGMGLVFGAVDRRKQEARDPNPYVALKVLNADFQRHPQSFMALQREARKAQTLAHPNVVTVFDFDRDGDFVYMTMELLKGRSLDAIAREARGKGIGRGVALPIIRGVAEGLAYAHRKGIVHSDLKPGNIFVAEDGTPKILDFGIARAVPSSVTEENRDEFDAGTLGAYTEAYATDEMVDGVDPHPADDMYALGIIAYELLTGMHPYQRHSAPNARKLGIKVATLKGVKRKEANAIERCLSFDRKLRPQNAGEFLKLFRGVTTLQKATMATAAVLAIAAGYLWYQNYLETSPAIPFEQLSIEDQQTFRERIEDANASWQFYADDHKMTFALNDAVQLYAQAYEIHPRNREAVAGLRKVADAWLQEAGDNRTMRAQVVETLRAASPRFYSTYSPVVDAAKQ